MSASTKELFMEKAQFDLIKSKLKSLFYEKARLVTETNALRIAAPITKTSQTTIKAIRR
jgi:hypothetical protein